MAHNSICRAAPGGATYFPNWMNPARARGPRREQKTLGSSKVSGESGAARLCLLVDVNKSKRPSQLASMLVGCAGQILLIGAPLMAARMTRMANRASGPLSLLCNPAGRHACLCLCLTTPNFCQRPIYCAARNSLHQRSLAVPFSSTESSPRFHFRMR